VARWHQRLGDWLQEIEPELPSERVWARVEQAIGASTQITTVRGTGLLDRLWFWRAAAAGAWRRPAPGGRRVPSPPEPPPVVVTRPPRSPNFAGLRC
jgi:hypothetical protein